MLRISHAPADRPVTRGGPAAHHLFSLCPTAPRAGDIVGALARLDRLRHDLPDLEMDGREWARLFAESHEQDERARSGGRRSLQPIRT